MVIYTVIPFQSCACPPSLIASPLYTPPTTPSLPRACKVSTQNSQMLPPVDASPFFLASHAIICHFFSCFFFANTHCFSVVCYTEKSATCLSLLSHVRAVTLQLVSTRTGVESILATL